MSSFSDRILVAIDLALDERHEFEARRAAEHRQIWIEYHALRKPDLRGNEYEIHLVDLETRRCIAVRHAWLQAHYLLQDLTAGIRQRLLEQARPCSLHPIATTPPAD
jgi:hypothetical protein